MGAYGAGGRMDVEDLDLLPVRHGLGVAVDYIGAQFDTEAVADVLAALPAPVGLVLGEDWLPAEFGGEVDVGTLGEFDVEQWGEGCPTEVGRRVGNEEVSRAVGVC